MKAIRYWLAINHLDRIKQYGLKSHLNYMFSLNPDTQERMWPIRLIAKMRVNNLLESV